MQAQARKLSPRIVEGIQATKSAISSGTTSGWGSSLALRELSGAIIGGAECFGGFDAMEATAVGDEVAEAILNPQPVCRSQPRRCRSARRVHHEIDYRLSFIRLSADQDTAGRSVRAGCVRRASGSRP
jgi:hypothetical protein